MPERKCMCDLPINRTLSRSFMNPSQLFHSFVSRWFPPVATSSADIQQRRAVQNDGLDAILLFGPDIGHDTKFHAEETCRRLDVSRETFDIAGAGSMETLRSHLHSGGK